MSAYRLTIVRHDPTTIHPSEIQEEGNRYAAGIAVALLASHLQQQQ
ncbi:hypothetical protein [Bacillus sp. FJAT-45037]|nr:hypothetical protein [Bacillus sp. FJAT-45037]